MIAAADRVGSGSASRALGLLDPVDSRRVLEQDLVCGLDRAGASLKLSRAAQVSLLAITVTGLCPKRKCLSTAISYWRGSDGGPRLDSPAIDWFEFMHICDRCKRCVKAAKRGLEWFISWDWKDAIAEVVAGLYMV